MTPGRIIKDTRRVRLMASRIKHPLYASGRPEFKIRGDLVFDLDSGFPFLKFNNVYLRVERAWAEQAMHEAQNNSMEVGQ